jgi:threonine dehydratase
MSASETELKHHVSRAISSVYEVAKETPLERLVIPGMEGVDLWVKREDLQAIHAYKIRGAYYAIKTAIAENQHLKTIVTASAGNHAQGVALSARVLGIKADIFMPLTTPYVKQNAVRLQGVLKPDADTEAVLTVLNHRQRNDGGADFMPVNRAIYNSSTYAGVNTNKFEIANNIEGYQNLDTNAQSLRLKKRASDIE